MKQIKNTNDFVSGDTFIIVPNVLRLNPKTEIIFNADDRCYEIDIAQDDMKSFGERIGVGKVIMANADIVHIVDVNNHEDIRIPRNRNFTGSVFSVWIL